MSNWMEKFNEGLASFMIDYEEWYHYHDEECKWVLEVNKTPEDLANYIAESPDGIGDLKGFRAFCLYLVKENWHKIIAEMVYLQR